MAEPPLDYQLRYATSVLVCRTTPSGFDVLEALKGPAQFNPDIKVFELLGYVRRAGETVVLIVMESGQIVNLLPVKDGAFVYDGGSVALEAVRAALQR